VKSNAGLKIRDYITENIASNVSKITLISLNLLFARILFCLLKLSFVWTKQKNSILSKERATKF